MEEGSLDERIEDADVADRESANKEGPEPRAEARAEYDSGEKVVYNSRDVKEFKQTNSKNLESIASEANESQGSRHGGKIYKGTVVIFYNVETGEILMEENPSNYGIPHERGKFRPMGGQEEPYVDSSSEATAIRELGEEVVQDDVKKILIKNLIKNGKSMGTLKEVINGQLSETKIIEVEVPYQQWLIARHAKPTHDAGQFYIKTHDEAWNMPDSSYASAYGQIYKQLILEKMVNNQDFLKNANLLPFNTTNRKNLGIVNSFNNYRISLN